MCAYLKCGLPCIVFEVIRTILGSLHEKPQFSYCAQFFFYLYTTGTFHRSFHLCEFPACNKDMAIIMWLYTIVAEKSACTPYQQRENSIEIY